MPTELALELRPFDPAEAATVSGWAPTAGEVLAWCSHPQAPVPADVIAEWGDQADVHAYALYERGHALVAYGELWIDDDEHEVELARLIVDPAHRNRAIGRYLTTHLAALAAHRYPDVFLRVRPDNTAALRCYAAAGFERVPAADEDAWNRGQPARYAWLAYRPQ